MKYFTLDGLNPNENTILLIKQIAYAYNKVVKKTDSVDVSLCLN